MDQHVIDSIGQIKGLGGFGLVVLALIGGALQWWVWGWAYRDLKSENKELKEEKDAWKSVALSNMHVADRSTRVADRSTRNLLPSQD